MNECGYNWREKQLADAGGSLAREVGELRKLNEDLLFVMNRSVREYDVTGEVTNILEMRATIAKAEKLK